MFVCPMHPEIRQKEPGNCSRCGMALEAEIPAVLSAGPDPETRQMSTRFWIGLLLTIPVVFLGMRHAPFSPRAAWIEFVLATPVVIWGGWPFFQRAWESLVHRSLNMFTLIALGTATAYLYSLGVVVLRSRTL